MRRSSRLSGIRRDATLAALRRSRPDAPAVTGSRLVVASALSLAVADVCAGHRPPAVDRGAAALARHYCQVAAMMTQSARELGMPNSAAKICTNVCANP